MSLIHLRRYGAEASVLIAVNIHLYDFLAPNLYHSSRKVRLISTTRSNTSTNQSYDRHRSSQSLGHPLRIPKSGAEAASSPAPTSKPLTQAQRDFLSSALRVNQAGELAATLIYAAQIPPLIRSHPQLRSTLKHMATQEEGHLSTFNKLIAKHRIRPTAMYPIWKLAASALGWGTAMLGREAAMACTEAVETEIGGHYNGQVKVLMRMMEGMEERGEEVGKELTELLETMRRIRDEELEHLDCAVENDSKQAVPHELLTGIIRRGCRGAIWVSERI